MQEQRKPLSEYVTETREKVGLSVQGLSKKSGLTIEQIEDIEAGKDLFLPATIRQKLAKGLKVNPNDIKQYERILIGAYDNVTPEYISDVKQAIILGQTDNLKCPICHSKLITRIVKLLDLENNTALHPKAQCSKCSFQIK